MEEFEKILKMTQPELKSYMSEYLAENGYSVVAQDGFLYAKGNLPVLLVAHLDRYPETNENCYGRYPANAGRVLDIEKSQMPNGTTKWSSPQGIGGDDRCGVWTIMQLIKSKQPSVLFTEDEEIGCIGARKFRVTDYIKNLEVNYMVEIDRYGANDIVFYNCQNEKFRNWVAAKTGYVTREGTSTDIRHIMPKCDIAGVNFSCGYYDEHFADEYVVIEEMQNTLYVIGKLLDENVTTPFPAQCGADLI